MWHDVAIGIGQCDEACVASVEGGLVVGGRFHCGCRVLYLESRSCFIGMVEQCVPSKCEIGKLLSAVLH